MGLRSKCNRVDNERTRADNGERRPQDSEIQACPNFIARLKTEHFPRKMHRERECEEMNNASRRVWSARESDERQIVFPAVIRFDFVIRERCGRRVLGSFDRE